MPPLADYERRWRDLKRPRGVGVQQVNAPHHAFHKSKAATFVFNNYSRMRGLLVVPKGELSQDLCSLFVKAATAAASKNWAELGE